VCDTNVIEYVNITYRSKTQFSVDRHTLSVNWASVVTANQKTSW